jgi:methionyl-tRNA synthetase
MSCADCCSSVSPTAATARRYFLHAVHHSSNDSDFSLSLFERKEDLLFRKDLTNLYNRKNGPLAARISISANDVKYRFNSS